MRAAVVTSCSAKGWLQYGKRFVETFDRHWPVEVELHIVSEDMPAGAALGSFASSARPIMFHELWKVSRVAREFNDRHARNLLVHGKVRREGDFGWTPKKIAAGYNFRLDAYRFSKKVFGVEAVSKWTTADLLFWVDADVVTFAPVPIGLLSDLLPGDVALACLDRGDYHSECGFVGYDLTHQAARPFIRELCGLYASDEFLHLKEWHDSWVFDYVRKFLHTPTRKIEHCSRHHPFVNSVLGHYMDHLKGSRKEAGRTPLHEMRAGFTDPYWRGAA